jgi:hypothetical protein
MGYQARNRRRREVARKSAEYKLPELGVETQARSSVDPTAISGASRRARILDEREITAAARLFRQTIWEEMGDGALAALGLARAADFVRWAALRFTCEEARKTLGLTIRDAARMLGVCQRELVAIEAGGRFAFEPAAAWRYFELLGLQKWIARWIMGNRELADRAGLLAPGATAGGNAEEARLGVGPQEQTFQFMVTLKTIRPPIWRRIVVPADSTFWELHVAIQGAMGWTDSCRHVFRARHRRTGVIDEIGIPDLDDLSDGRDDRDGRDDLDDRVELKASSEDGLETGWNVAIADYFQEPGHRADYEYDFHDRWEHIVAPEAIHARVAGIKYPVCLAGARACPPEGMGGIAGYEDLMRLLRGVDPATRHQIQTTLGRDYDPDAFDPRAVRFADPEEWRRETTGENDFRDWSDW